jgi:hypothetical protein
VLFGLFEGCEKMNEEISPKEALKKIESLLEKTEDLLKKDVSSGELEREELNIKIEGFIRTVFKDDDKKLQDYRKSLRILYFFSGVESVTEKQEDYMSRLRSMKNHLSSFKEELQLIIDSKTKSEKIDGIQKKTELSMAEAQRREAVADGKKWGGMIEFIQLQRDELKKKDFITKEIVDIKKDIADLKNMFEELISNLSKGSEKKG